MPQLPASPDRIALRGLKVECIIGFIEWERRVPQTVSIDLELPIDCRRASGTDQIADSLDYQKVAASVTRLVAESRFNLLETMAEQIATLLFGQFGVEWVRLSVKKTGSLPGLREAEVSIERTAASS